jgi:hypothetical protein
MKNLLNSNKRTPIENRQKHKTMSASSAKVESTHSKEAHLWSDFNQRSIDHLRSLAALCRFGAENPTDELFAALLDEAHQLRVISEQSLAEIARVDRSTANRWLNGKAKLRARLAQVAIMEAIAKLSDDRADGLALGMKEDASNNNRDKPGSR